jgi:hypothetical protein
MVLSQGACQTQLGISEYHQPGPAVRLVRVAHTRKRPIERLFEEAKGMLDVEAPHVRAPDAIQVWNVRLGRTGGSMPPQPEGLRLTRLLRQATDLPITAWLRFYPLQV